MNFTVDNKTFLEYSNIITSAVMSTDPLASIILKINTDKVEMIARTNTSSCKGYFNIESQEELEETVISVNVKQFKALLSILPQQSADSKNIIMLNFNYNTEKKILQVSYKSNKININVIEDPIMYPEEEISTVGVIETSVFDRMNRLLRLVNKSTVTSNVSSCLALTFEENKLVIMATSYFALGEVTLDYMPNTENNFNVLLMHQQVRDLIRNDLKDVNKSITFIKTDNMFGYKDDLGITMLVSTSDMKPLNYAQLKVSEYDECEVELDTPEFMNIVRNIDKISPESQNINVIVNNEQVKVISETGDIFTIANQDSNLNKEYNLCLPKQHLLDTFGLLDAKLIISWDDGDRQQLVRLTSVIESKFTKEQKEKIQQEIEEKEKNNENTDKLKKMLQEGRMLTKDEHLLIYVVTTQE